MSEPNTAQRNPWNTMSGGWKEFDADCYAQEEQHERAYLNFARMVEGKIEELLPEDLGGLAEEYAQFRHDRLDEVICEADRSYGHRMTYYHAALELFKDFMEDSPLDITDFAVFIRKVEAVVDPIMGYFRELPEGYFSIPCSDRNRLFKDLHAVILGKLANRLAKYGQRR